MGRLRVSWCPVLSQGRAAPLLIAGPGCQVTRDAVAAGERHRWASTAAQTRAGVALLAAAVIGFVAYGVARLVGAATDGGQGTLRRVSTAGQGAVCLAFAWVTGSFLLGQRSAGSEQQRERTTGVVLALPGGRALVVTVGAAVVGVCLWRLIVAAKGHFGDTLNEEDMSRPVHALVWLIARIGIVARALAYAPVGVLLIIAGVRSDPQRADGLGAVLLELTRTGWGRVLVALIAVGFVVVPAYSLIEARYREVTTGA